MMREPRDSTETLKSQTWRIEQFRVRVIDGPDSGLTAESSGTEFTIGTARGNTMQLHDPSVSRHHCVLEVGAEGVLLRDLGSTNGTTLGGSRIITAFASPGAVIGVGQSLLSFERTHRHLEEPLSDEPQFGEVLGQSVAMRRLFAQAKQIANSDATVLIEGETGTGKGLLASAIHEASLRKDGPFVIVDCGAIPATLIESELFGHEKGSFTGASAMRVGLFEAASGGTVFLDEIGELPLELQPRLLRVLENREIRRVGSQTTRPVDVRILVATNRDLRHEVNTGSFRADLWYRLNTVRLVVPPLRDRAEDIPLLTAHFYAQVAPDPESPPPPDLVAAMQRGMWPGNVRELRSAVERGLILGAFDAPHEMAPRADDASAARPEEFEPGTSFRAAKLRAVQRWESHYLTELMRRNEGNLSQASRAARMNRGYLRQLLRKHGVRAPSSDGADEDPSP